MPYKSDAQRRFMHAKHPEIAAKWDEEIRAKRKKGRIKKYSAVYGTNATAEKELKAAPKRTLRKLPDTELITTRKKGQVKKLAPVEIEKSKRKELAAGLGVAVVGGAAANQIPPIQTLRRKKKKDVSKSRASNLEPVWIQKNDDPYFNHEVAEKVFDLVSKMDDDTAQMFSYFTACEMLDEDIQKNRRTLQRHVDDIVRKRMNGVKKALVTIAKRDGDTTNTLAYAQAIDRLEEIIKATPYDYGFRFQESQVRRNERGQFATEVKVNEAAKPWTDKQMKAMGHDDAVKRVTNLEKEKGTRKLGAKSKAQFQQEYTQLANFLQTHRQSGGDSAGDKVLVHVQNKRTGQQYTVPAQAGGKVPQVWDPRIERVTGIEARPVQANMAGASYNLAQALGGSPEGATRAAFYGERLDQNIKPFQENWTTGVEGDNLNTNARTYRRVETGSKFVGAVAPPGSSVHNAARLAQFAGQHGPEAEKVFGPAARKTAYRYRGTEKTPEKHIVDLYDRAVTTAKLTAPYDRGMGPEVTGRKAHVSGKPSEVPAVSQMAGQRSTARDRTPTWSERESGRNVIMQQLGFKIPNRHLYGLNLAAGNTPPSEGILLNRDGQIVTQAVGYGDDHYLPFNLKNLKALKGGEYIRTRSVGGPTSEDIYTGLLTGARRITVISRSGTFTLEFDETLRGGRRYNDKAMRMTDRYEHLLDAVESEQVDAKPVPDYVRDRIQQDIERDYGDWSPAEQKRMYRQKEEEYKSFGTSLTKEDKNYIESRIQLERDRDPTADAKQLRSELTAQALSEKEFKFRLNGEGYSAALEALQEQFPYYLKVTSRPRRDAHISEPEKDKGYVMPRHNRPAEAKHGYFNPRIAGEGKIAYQGEKAGQLTGKTKASEADYQNLAYANVRTQEVREEGAAGAAGAVGGGGTSGSGEEGGAPSNQGGTPEEKKVREVRENIRDTKDADAVGEAAWALIKATPRKPEYDAANELSALVTADDKSGFMAKVKTPEGRANLNRMIANAPAGGYKAQTKQYADYVVANAKVDRKNYTDLGAFIWEDKPYKFPDEVYRKTADPTLLENKLKDLNAHSFPVSSSKTYREMSDQEKKEELERLNFLSTKRDVFKVSPSAQRALFTELGIANPGNAAKLLNDKDPSKAILKAAKRLHQVRTLQHNQDAQLTQKTQNMTDTPTQKGDYDPGAVSRSAGRQTEREAGGPVANVGTAPKVGTDTMRKLESSSEMLKRKADLLDAFPRAAEAMRNQAKIIDKHLEVLNSPDNPDRRGFHPDQLDELNTGAQAMMDETDMDNVPLMVWDPRDKE